MATTRSRGYLPHWEGENAIYFVTFRLADSLPSELLTRLRHHRQLLEQLKKTGAGVAPDRTHLRHLRTILRRAERCLDSGLGHCYMRDFRIAQVVAEAVRHFNGQRYRLIAWCVMPNHVHVVFSPLDDHKLQAIVHSWKSFSAEAANRLLQRTGRFWQREYFDHLVCSEASLLKFTRYVRENPQRSGLSNWPWVGVASEVGFTRVEQSAGWKPALQNAQKPRY